MTGGGMRDEGEIPLAICLERAGGHEWVFSL